jgi:mannosylglycerate hydrolase
MARRVHIVPHTHWDREWYLPYQAFRLKLVDLLDDLIPALEADPGYAHFLLDGQMAVVEDHLAVRPGAEEPLRRLVASGRVAMGPWYALPDEFLVSGETLVRNLQRGLRVAARFGGAMEVGYLPDMFGHVAQMPQLLRGFGMEHAVVWRGVPAAVDRTGFWWRSPDGSEVRAEYLPQGYGNGAQIPDDAKDLLARIGDWVDGLDDLVVGPVLWMNGSDHLPPQPYLGRVVAEANEIQDRWELVVTSLEEHLREAPTAGLPVWEGELRSGARANLLMGVASNRVDVKQAAARAERALERLAEPLNALLLPADAWPEALLDAAWLEVIRNSAHDSVCACSVDEVCDAVLVRYAEATHIAEGLAERALGALGAVTSGDGPLVVNPTARPRGGVVELRLPGEGVPEGTQLISARPPERVIFDGVPASMAAVVAQELEWTRAITGFRIEALDTGDTLLAADRDRSGTLVSPAVRARLEDLRTGEPDRSVRVRVSHAPGRKVLARVEDVAGFGWQAWEEASLAVPPVEVGDDGRSMGNGLVRVEVDPDDGTFGLDGLAGLGRLVDDGDVGDTYNWCPPERDVVVHEPTDVRIEVAERGPVRARLVVHRGLEVPARAQGGERVGTARLEVATTLELRAGEDLVRVAVAFDNHGVRDHRLRAWFPLPRPATTSTAECAFASVERGLHPEGGPTEAPLATYPSRRWVSAGGLTVVHEGLLEHELVDLAGEGDSTHAGALAVTLARCTGMLSQAPMATRPLPAGPLLPMEGPQLQQPLELHLAVHAGGRDPWAVADEVLVPLQVTRSGGGSGPRSGQALRVEGAEVSAVLREGGSLLVRVHNPWPEATEVRIDGRSGWLVDLRGRPLAPFDGGFALGPWQIATARLG